MRVNIFDKIVPPHPFKKPFKLKRFFFFNWLP